MPERQDNLQRAVARALEALTSQTNQQLLWLGAQATGDGWRLPVLNAVLDVDLHSGRVTSSHGKEVGMVCRVLVLHYLAIAAQPDGSQPQIAFADLPSARTYAGVYHQRVNARLCATVGRTAASLQAAALALGGRPAPGGDAAFDFDLFPRLRARLVWHAGDEEFPPTATLLLPATIEAFFCIEDIVVLSEHLVGRLQGRGP